MKVELVIKKDKRKPLPEFEVIPNNNEEKEFLRLRQETVRFIIKEAVTKYHISNKKFEERQSKERMTINDTALFIWENVREAFDSYTIKK